MSIFQRFFGKNERTPNALAPGAPLVAATELKDALSLQLLFGTKPKLDPAAITRTLRQFDKSTSQGACELDDQASQSGTPIGLLGWGPHVIRIVGFDAPMPADVVERCVAPSHYGADLKANARAHQAHILLYYAGTEPSKLEQYVALAVAAAVFGQHGAIVVTNESGHTSFPAAALFADTSDRLAPLRSLPIPILCSGLVKFDVEGTQGVWMRTFGNNLLGIPDFAHLAAGHHEGQKTFALINNVTSYLLKSGARFAPGHTMEVGATTLKVRLPEESEYFLECEGELFVLETSGG